MMLKNKVAVITGATRGIGREIARTYAENGAKIVMTGTNHARLQALYEDISLKGAECIAMSGDVREEETAEKVVQEAINQFQRVDILVNNAGVNQRSSTLDMAINDWKRVIDTNLNGNLYFSRAVLPYMIKQKQGKIINISSTAAKSGHPNAAPSYGASKAAVDYLTKHLALEMAPYNIVVNGLSPGPIETEMVQQWHDEYRKKVLTKVPLKRLGKPKDIAGAALFLASDLSGFITGETININGGTYMN
ncbi:SDR family oxidoreductase [Salipaludibacillus agaradhaerens]|uniref:SDR family oxidoreductase n=1 Tax=Salipaludibacillus agaradhaerens TaxID=76935 RepID=A0A9Q4G0W4_SALAG|nr:SDR family NAD(P)-dependent oxidoreductase [Salipaludibacillus agaradhaerens]MCR6098239.1 SDR family oxidoreductase [Salipaludibacillus agaradhaerens]MCR6116131.1 SDR family oxidoreductase [Salipaludibacillus agaradhaerens]